MKNDQAQLIQYLKEKDYQKAWEIVRYVGYSDVPNIRDRYIVFFRAVNAFSPDKNNNFILFYKKHLATNDLNRFDTFYLTTTPSVINELKREAISPTIEKRKRKSKVDELKKWQNKLGEIE